MFQFLVENVTGFAERFEPTVADQDHPLYWSILELLEGIIFGIDEDFQPILSGGSFEL
jgi:hypothetical protein